MKATFLAIAILSLMTASCSKQDYWTDNGCIERFDLPVTSHSIDSKDVQTLNSLFAANGIDYRKYRYYSYEHDTFRTLYAPYKSYDQKHVRLEQYENGLRIFTGSMIYIFWDGILHYQAGPASSGLPPDTSPRLSLEEVRKLFVADISRFGTGGSRIRGNCIRAEFGYYDLNSGISNAQEEIVKAWRLSLNGSNDQTGAPFAYYQDSSGTLLYYDDGLRTFR